MLTELKTIRENGGGIMTEIEIKTESRDILVFIHSHSNQVHSDFVKLLILVLAWHKMIYVYHISSFHACKPLQNLGQEHDKTEQFSTI